MITKRPLWLVLLSMVAFACGLGVAVTQWRSTPAEDPEPAFMLSALPADNVAPEFSLQDGSDRQQTLAKFRGRVVVMFFGFTRCPDVCPTELFKLTQVMQSLGDDASGVQVLFVTLDPERDTPALMQTYTAAFDPSFIGLTGTRAEIDKVAADYYVAHAKAGPPENYVIDHSTSTYIIDTAGRLRLIGKMDTSVEAFSHDIRLLLQNSAS